ncbi:Hypothetical_protein [Hexamita inflata]|uniref:Hypothetical_protein n=1 Tax=Hexamita inflata TaxID=28002 RepID=A0AA86RIW8_9EUKA|nr:Hypothetical protein HINF_LOCUS63268 [Hexamita inflata]
MNPIQQTKENIILLIFDFVPHRTWTTNGHSLQQQKGTEDKERQKYVKLQTEIEELKKYKRQLVTNQAKLYNKEQLEDEVQKRVQTETDIIYKEAKEVIKQNTVEIKNGYQSSYDQLNNGLCKFVVSENLL